ncbi:MAG: ABC transporter ATP-binding protein [Gammaproteobacteria bacterium]|nr:ABC transporter ATP-binding protein [Gammaproteobacteria bacterium]
MIEADQLTRRYGDFLAVANVSFAIQPGEIVGLLGHNGAGKTTIMKMLTGYLEPSAGAVRVDGVDVEQDPLAVQARLGYLPENLPLYPEMSVSDYLAFAAELRGAAPKAAVQRAIAATELEEKALEPISTLSRGFKQRVGVAQAILHEPKFLILDEPTNGLDPSQTQHMRELIQRLAQDATVILSTHIMQEVDAICDRALILLGGELVLDERLQDLKQSNELRLRCGDDSGLAASLSNVAGLVSAEQMKDGTWRLTVTGELDAASNEVARAVVGAGLPLHEISAIQRDLETVFREVNEGVQDAA